MRGTEPTGRLMVCVRRLFASAVPLTVAAVACGTPTSPSNSHRGTWAGTTSQGGEISFTVSDAEIVTSITVDFRVGSCAGTKRFEPISSPIATPTGGNPIPGSDRPAFGY